MIFATKLGLVQEMTKENSVQNCTKLSIGLSSI